MLTLLRKGYQLESYRKYSGPRSVVAGNLSAAADILCFSHLRWQFVTQRPQHLLSRAAKDRRVFYWEEPIWHNRGELPMRGDGTPGMHLEITQQGPSLWVVQPHITSGLDSDAGQRALLHDFIRDVRLDHYVAWFYTPMAVTFTEDCRPAAVVYDCMDELSAFKDAPPQLIAQEHRLFERADVVFTGGFSLYEAKRLQHANVHAFPSSIDVNHFASAAEVREEPADQADLPHPRCGFYGVVDERFDTALLSDVARLRPDVHFIILGPIVKIDPATLPQSPNIHYLPGKTYEELPRYLAGWDVALMPFALNDATRFISPTKTPEYLAAGKPVVSTPIRDVVRTYGQAGVVAIAATPEEFASAIDSALQPASEDWKLAVSARLAESSWDSTWASMQREIQTVLATQPAQKTSSLHGTGAVLATKTRLAVPINPAQNIARQRVTLKQRFDWIVVGAGFAGSVLAERLASQMGQRVLIIDKRDHIAGNAYDCPDEHGVLVHKYGPHIFHTNSDKVLAYLTQFTEWRPYEHRVLTSVDNQLLPLPINLDSINRMYGLSLDAEGMQEFLRGRAETIDNVRTSEDFVVSRVGRELYEKFFRNYTRKQWGLDPSQLDASVAARIPVRFSHDDRYFTDTYQMMPLKGYTRMFERMLDHPLITIRTGVQYQDIIPLYPDAQIVYTGPIDEYFDFRLGPLPYRSLEFRHETHDREVYQPAAVVNYPNDHAYTRVTEFKYLTGQKHPKTSIVYEYPRSAGDPYYPIPRPENAALYARYKDLADRALNVHFCGRLANYRYLNMDQVVAQALTTFRRIADEHEISLPVRASATDSRAQARLAVAMLDRAPQPG